MKEKISYVLKKCKFVLIVCLILWILISVVFIAPISISWVDAISNDSNFIENMLTSDLGNISGNLGKAFSKEYLSTFLKNELILAVVLLFFAIVGMVKTMPKHDYADAEHGSSDWAKGEQYSILSKKKGILLAEKHYLPVDKRGNVNVLIVGRIWFW